MALNNFIGRRKWKAQFESGLEAFNAGDFKSSEAYLRQALEHASSISERDASYGETALLLGQVYRRTERFDDADLMTKKAFDYYESVFGTSDPRTIRAHMAIVLARPERSQADLDIRKATFEMTRSEFGPKSWQAIRTAALALPSFASHQRESVLNDVQQACNAALGEERMSLATWPPVAEEFADALARMGYLELATRYQGFQLKMNEERFGPKSQEAALARIRLGDFFLQSGHPDKAEVAFSRAIENIRLKLGPRSESVQNATVSLARALARQKKLHEAAPFLTEALVTLRPNQVEERIEVLVALLEHKCFIAGTDSERGALWQELESFWERADEEETRQVIFEGLLAAQVRLQQAWELPSADRLLHAILARVRQWRGPHHPDVARVLMELAACAVVADDRAKTRSFLEQSIALDEGLQNLTRAARICGALGEWIEGRKYGDRAGRLIAALPFGVERGRAECSLAQAMLECGDTRQASDLACQAVGQLPEQEQGQASTVIALVGLLEGHWNEALPRLAETAEKATDPYERALNHLWLGWVYCQSGRLTDAKMAVKEGAPLVELRPEHPVAYQLHALSSQIAFYSGAIYEGKELRQKVMSFLKPHQHASRSVPILSLLEPYGPEDANEEFDLGMKMLNLSRYPEGNLYAFPLKDVAFGGLRHVTRALQFQDKVGQAKERLQQYRERILAAYVESNPMASPLQITASFLLDSREEKIRALELAVSGMRALSERHVGLYPALVRLTRLYIRTEKPEKAVSTCRQALEIRQSPRFLGWMELLEKDILPELEPSGDRPSGEVSVEYLPTVPVEVVNPEEPAASSSSDSLEVPREDLPAGESTADLEPGLDSKEMGVVPSDETASVAVEPAEATKVRRLQPSALISSGGREIAELGLARVLSERAEPPSEREVQELLAEVAARFGEEPRPHVEARVMLCLLYDDGAEQATRLWKEALERLDPDDSEQLLEMETRARDAHAWSLVLQTLQERLQREIDRFGENSVETLSSQLKLARALESAGRLDEAYNRLTLVGEVLRSWFGARSRRLLEPLGDLIRVAEARNDVHSAFEHQLDRHRILESGESDAEELFRSRISLLPLRARLGQIEDLLNETEACEKEMVGFRGAAPSEFVRTLLVAAERVDRLHWRSDIACKLLETALRAASPEEISLGCAIRLALAESYYRKDYRAQSHRVRSEAIDMAGSLDSEARAEVYHAVAQSCLRTGEVDVARAVAERVLEERIAAAGRKDLWAGRALLVMAEADLKQFRLEGTETAISMSAPSLKGTRYWGKALALKLQALFFLYRYEEAAELLEQIPEEQSIEVSLKLAVWQGRGAETLARIEDPSTVVGRRWREFESLPLSQAAQILEFFARVGQAGMLAAGMTRIWRRATSVPPADVRHARLKLLGAQLQFWESDWDGSANTLQQTLEMVPSGAIEFPEGLASSVVRGLLVQCLLKAGRATSALNQAQLGVAEAAELLGEEDVRSFSFRVYLAHCARALGRQDDSLVMYDDIVNALQDHLGETHVLLRDVFVGFAQAFLDQEDLESARMSAEEALRIDKECRGLSIHLIHDLELLSEIEQSEDVSEALNQLDAAIELASQLLPEKHVYTEHLAGKRAELARVEQLLPQPPSLVPPSAEEESGAEQLFREQEVDGPEQASVPDVGVDSPDALFDLPAEEPQETATAPEVSSSEGEAEEAETSLEDFFEIPPVVEAEQASAEIESFDSGAEESAEALFVETEEPLVEEQSAEELFAIDDAPAEPDKDVHEGDLFEIDPIPEAATSEPERDEFWDEDEEQAGEEQESLLSWDDDEEPEEPELLEEPEGSAEGLDSEQEAPVAELSAEEVPESEQAVEEPAQVEPAGLETPVELSEEAEEPITQPEAGIAEAGEAEAAPVEELEAEVEEAELGETVLADQESAGAPDPSFEVTEESQDRPLDDSLAQVSEGAESAGREPELDGQEPEFDLHDPEPVEAEEHEVAPQEQADELQPEEVEKPEETELGEGADHTEETPAQQMEPVSVELTGTDPTVEEKASQLDSPRAQPYKLSAKTGPGLFAPTSPSVEFEPGFPEVPLRLPHITEPEFDEEGPDEPSIEDSLEVSVGESQEQELSLERLLEIRDPESSLLPLAPVFFLPVPWKEATEAPFESRFEELYVRFQQAYKKDEGWREVVEDAVSLVRCNPGHQSGYFLFLLGAQLEKSGNLHIADICLATAIEFLESGPAYGAACHQAGRVAGRRGELGRALEYFDRSAELAGEAELAVLKIDAAECHLGMGRPEEALIGFEEVFEFLSENVPKVQAIAVQAKMAQIHLLIGDPDASQGLAEQTRKSLSPKNVGTYRVLGRILLSRAFARLGRHDLALKLAEAAWEGAQPWSAKRKDGRRIAISNLVDIYHLLGRYEDALTLVHESGLTGWGLAEAELLLRAGHVSCALGRLDDARKYNRLGKSFLTRFRSPALWRSSFHELEAEILMREGDFTKAWGVAEEALKVFEREATGPVDRSRHIVRSAKIAAAMGQSDKAKTLLEQAYSLRDLHLGADHPHTSSVEGLTAILDTE